MGAIKTLLTVVAAINTVAAISIPPYGFARQVNTFDPPKWMLVNETTADAKGDGSVGVILEPDLVYEEGKQNTGKDGATIKKIKFGPYVIQPGQKREYPIGMFGLTPIEVGRALPCTDCYITAMQLNLEYPDGSIANVDTGAWLHHVDISVTGVDYTCPSNWISTIVNGGDPAMAGARIYSGGNERVPVRMNSKQKFGIDPGRGTMGGALELMSESTKVLTLYVTLIYEFVPKSTPGYREAKLVWVDVTNCARQSDFKPSTGAYSKESGKFKMNHNGELLFAQGHAHDGGVRVELMVNGEVSCNSKQIYGNRRGHFYETLEGGVIKGLLMPPNSHISDVAVCKDWGTVKKGDVLSVRGYYDDKTHMQMMNARGGLEDQMGIMWTYVGLTD